MLFYSFILPKFNCGRESWTEMIGIYKIENLVNGKVYIGQSINIEQRWYTHKSELNRNVHYNRHLQNAWNKYGADNFIFEIIEECNNDIISQCEIYWIDYYNSSNINYGYNLSTGGECSCKGVKLTDQQKEYMSKVKNPEEIVQIDLDGNLIKIWRSASHAQRMLNIRACCILKCANHKVYQANGYIWLYKKEYDLIHFDVKEYKYKHRRYFDIPILQYDLYGNLINKWTISDLKNRYGKERYNVIRAVCNHKKCSYDGFIWLYEYENFILSEEYLKHCRRSCGRYYIDQFDMNMNHIKTWKSSELLHSDYFDIYSINKVCDNRSLHHKNYIWKEYIPTY